MTEKLHGPAAYFPSIVARYGKPIEHWQEVIITSGLTEHREIVGLLTVEHGLGHGHANALVAYTIRQAAQAQS